MKKEKNLENEIFQLNKEQIYELIKIANFEKKDIFYDLGCGAGNVVIEIAKTNVLRSIGIESSRKYYEIAKNNLYQQISNKEIKNYKKIDFWLSHIDNQDVDNSGKEVIDFSDATVIFYSMDEHEEFLSDLKSWNLWNKSRIIKKDIPLVGYESYANRKCNDCWFFLTDKNHKRIKSKKVWAKSISEDFNGIDDVYEYYFKQLYDRFKKMYLIEKKSQKYSEKIARKNTESSLLQLKMVVNDRFFYN